MNSKNNDNPGAISSPQPDGQQPTVCIYSAQSDKSTGALRDLFQSRGWNVLPQALSNDLDPVFPGRFLAGLKDQPRNGLLLIHGALTLNLSAIDRLRHFIASAPDSGGDRFVITALTNTQIELNPFAGLEQNPELTAEPGHAADLVSLLGPGRLHPAPSWPLHLAFLSHGALEIMASKDVSAGNALARLSGNGGKVLIADSLFVADLNQPVFVEQTLEPGEERRPAAWGELTRRLDDWLQSEPPVVQKFDLDRAPVTLHVSHSWGGGIAQWVRSFIAHDEAGLNLQLLSEGPQNNEGAGQRLSLYLGNKTEAAVATWWLQAPIHSTTTGHDQYQSILQEITQRYGVGRIIASSLVGHSLDVLRTGLPTLQVLHDFYPLWPLLGVHPGPYLEADSAAPLKKALDDHKLLPDLSDQDAVAWATLATAWRECVTNRDIKLVAPSHSVASMLRSLDPKWAQVAIEIIPHGLPELPVTRKVKVRDRTDKKLRLIIPGRVQEGKGRDLLLEALPELTRYAQIYLVGAGKEGEAFFGRSGVDVILQYRNEKLSDVLATIGPHVAALLSIVPETFSYTLSEMQQLNIPVLATRVGSLEERLADGKSGWLIEPTAESLVQKVRELAEDRDAIASMRKSVATIPHKDVGEMIGEYYTLCPPTSNASTHVVATQPDPQQSGSLAFQKMELGQRLRTLTTRADKLQQEVEERTQWAEERQQVLEEEQHERQQHVDSLNQQIDQRFEELQEARAEFDKARKIADKAHRKMQKNKLKLELTRQALNDTRQKLEESQQVRDECQRLREESERLRVESQLQAQQALEQARLTLEQTQLSLEQRQQQYTKLKTTHEWVLASSSWRITKPLRVGRRIMSNFIQAKVWNPMRWPLLLSQLVRTIQTQGFAGAVARAQLSHQKNFTPERIEVAEVEDVGSPDVPESFPSVESPDVSIIIPVHNKWAYTAACLRSVAETANKASYEVIVVDDQSSDQTNGFLRQVDGLILVTNEKNLGFIGACNRGAEQARGSHLVMLNNDAQVLDGWLDALLDTFQQFPDTGMAGARLIYPDGRLQEAGGIIFNDGSGWNYGRDDDPDKPEYQYVREVDYCSGACIMLETSVYRELGGFDTHYAPAYYEDTDLAFRVRQKGLKVRVQPLATIIHHEGVSSGTDISSGVKKYQAVNREKFLQRWQTELAQYPHPLAGPEDTQGLRQARDHRLKGRILVIDAYTPEPDQDSGSLRLRHLLNCMRDLGYGVTFFAENRGHSGKYTTEIQQDGVEAVYNPWLESLPSFFKERGPDFDFIMISRHYVALNFLSLMERYCPNAKFLFDTVDLHYLRETRLAELENSVPLKQVAQQTRRSELAIIAEADATLVVSTVEKSVLESDAPDARVHVVSNVHEVVGSQRDWADRKDIFFVGGYQHPPNVDAAIWFVQKIWPLVREKMPEARFHLIGSKAPDKVSALHGNGVEFHGFVETLEPWLDGCRVAVAPLRYGAGVKGKVNISMSRGQPVVATPMAVEGMFVTSGKEVLVAETEEKFAAEVVRVYQDEALWNSISSAGLENVRDYFSVETARRSLQNLLQDLDNSA